MTDELGNFLSETVWPITNGTTQTNVIKQDVYVYQSGGAYFDELRRGHDLYQWTQGGGTRVSQYRYSCCGLEYSIDADGIRTEYGYDSLHRLTSTSRFVDVQGGANQFIKTESVLDPVGRTTATVRYGTDNSSMTLEQKGYDILGRVAAQTNALFGVTTFSEVVATNKLQRATLFHDGGTSTNFYYRDGNLEKVTGSAIQPVRYAYGVESNTNSAWYHREYTQEIKLNSAYQDTGEWTKTYRDGLGNVLAVVYPDGASQQSWYNSLGQLTKTTDPDGATQLFQYNNMAELEYSVTDMNANGSINLAGTDRVSRTVRDVYWNGSKDVQRVRTYVWATNNVDVSTLVSTAESSTDGLKTWQTVHVGANSLTTTTERGLASGGVYTVTTTQPDGSKTTAQYRYGRLTSTTRQDANSNTLSQTSFDYDSHGRRWKSTDARNGSTTYAFNNADQVISVTSPAPGTGQPAQVTGTDYDSMGRACRTTQPDGSCVTNELYLTGLLKRTYGSRAYPVGYGYDPQGRMTAMTNWSGFATGAGERVTTWSYSTSRGWLLRKVHPGESDNNDDYDYTSAGRLNHRYWERGVTTTYTYSAAGELATVSYSDGTTPNVTHTYDRLGRRTQVQQGSNTATFEFNEAGLLLRETNSAGILFGLTITNNWDTYLRRTSLTLFPTNGASAFATSFGYDAASRLSGVTNGTVSASYGYLANSPLISTLTFKQSGTTRMTTTRQHDFLHRLVNISSVPLASGQPPVSFAYQYDAANQRRRATLADGSYWAYDYDSLGQVTAGKRYWPEGTPVPGQQFEYSFDDIGNRTQAKSGGDQSGVSLRSASYTNNVLNQITGRDVPAGFDVLGLAHPQATVKVNGSSADYRHEDYFQEALTVSNGSASVWQSVSVTATNSGASTTWPTGYVFVPKTPEVFAYDGDGNLTSDGRWTYTWDGENRLLSMVSLTNTPTESKRKLEFAYDFQGRRISKRVSCYTNATWQVTLSNLFAYDGWNLIGELNATNRALIRGYVWGLDLSGSLHGAGGVGGLLCEVPAGSNSQVVAYDGNGNVVALVDATIGSVAANYEYGPFGEVIRVSGSMAKGNPLQFSSKYQDEESSLHYYGYRYYNASIGRWPSRDPAAEGEFFRRLQEIWSKPNTVSTERQHAYRFTRNQPTTHYDLLGLLAEPPFDHRKSCCAELALWIPCSEICRMARQNPEISRLMAGGQNVCFHKKACGCLAPWRHAGYYPGECPVIDAIIQYHEDQHTEKMDCPDCGLHLPSRFKPGVDEDVEECRERRESLRRLLAVVGTLGEKCDNVAEKWIDELKRQVEHCSPGVPAE